MGSGMVASRTGSNHHDGMTDKIQPEATTDKPAKRLGWDVAWFGWLKNPPEFVAAFCYLLGYLSASLWLIAIVTIIGRLLLISIGVMQPSDKDGDIKAATVLLPTLAAVAAAPFLIWRLIMMQSQTTTALEKLEIDRETQNTALYLKAVEMLGSMKEEKTTELVGGKLETKTISKPNLEIRTGSIFALEKLASISERDQPAILEILCGYIRYNSGLDDYDRLMVKHDVKGWPEPRQDIQSAIKVIGQRKDNWLNAAANAGLVRLDEAKLMRIDMTKLDFSGAFFGSTNLQFTCLWWASLENAFLYEADLIDADLYEANLQGANLAKADLTDVIELIQEQINSAKGDEETILPLTSPAQRTGPPPPKRGPKPPPRRKARTSHQLAATFNSLIASQSATPPPTRLVT